jgi:signal transduction histidine kinase
MAQRLEDLLDVARYSRGAFHLKKQPVDLSNFFPQAIDRIRPLLEQNQQQLITGLPPDLPVVELDPSRMEQVLINLLSNAAKYSPKGKNVYLKVTFQESTLRVDIRDEGAGISPEEQSTLFQPYHRVQQDRKIPGLGLGLAVCKQIVDAHGGRIWVESAAGKGSTFSFEIPATALKQS